MTVFAWVPVLWAGSVVHILCSHGAALWHHFRCRVKSRISLGSKKSLANSFVMQALAGTFLGMCHCSELQGKSQSGAVPDEAPINEVGASSFALSDVPEDLVLDEAATHKAGTAT